VFGITVAGQQRFLTAFPFPDLFSIFGIIGLNGRDSLDVFAKELDFCAFYRHAPPIYNNLKLLASFI